MDLHEELEAFARANTAASGSRLRDRATRAHLEARVTRGRRVQNVKMGAGVLGAAGALAAGVIAAPHLGLDSFGPAGTPTTSQPEPSSGEADSTATVSPSPAPSPASDQGRPELPDASSLPAVADLPSVGEDGYLAATDALWTLEGPLACEAVAAADYPGAQAEAPFLGSSVPIPAVLETGRLYGWGDDVLVGGYPIPIAPLTAEQEAAGDAAGVEQYGRNAILVITSADGLSWGYSLEWSIIQDPVHDQPGTFVALADTYSCNGDGVPPEGVYHTRLAYLTVDGTNDVMELAPVRVVSGVPSLPEVDALG
ncbi:hypothetical protein LGT39_09735 [Demequina sp. TTPB684]|uniref:hypothetical protein n=1 Tax=unclassified Demequina TaxID=2620311 RepID=UPI001CF589A7|nr:MULTISPECIES: hypothetical protein [unclassified Demequina]MCB2413122.1 hypothetical protein [Demequina sp. TTPB684]UPU87516.1 hypothetical protein LGT36_009620 [Demequina sp. TMPB413]